MTSVISSLRRMLLNWPDAPANTRRALESLLAEAAATPPCRQLSRCAGILAPLAPRQDADYRHRFLGAIALFLSHLPGEQPLDPPR
ncbi:hypothetical protein LNQ52_23450 [Klebsiella pneumoniae subsp. pneumoniae]|nr:hypothetical protein [Klebsiella pneumoniae subsp. pneumoniae]